MIFEQVDQDQVSASHCGGAMPSPRSFGRMQSEFVQSQEDSELLPPNHVSSLPPVLTISSQAFDGTIFSDLTAARPIGDRYHNHHD
jgi:hypothetical protein